MAGDLIISAEAVERQAQWLEARAFSPLSAAMLRRLAEENATLLAQRDAEARAGFERGVREAAAWHERVAEAHERQDQAWKRMFGKIRSMVEADAAAEHREMAKMILALLAPAAIDEGTQR